MSTELHRLLCERRTIHEFAPGEVSDSALERGIRAAVSAPNHRMTEPWGFVRVGPQTREKLLALALELKSVGGPLPESASERLRKKFNNPAVLLIACQKRVDRPDIQEEDYASVACAIHNLSLSLWAEGIGSKWSTGAVTRDPSTYRILGLDSDQQTIVGFVWVGLPASDARRKPSRRRELSDVLVSRP